MKIILLSDEYPPDTAYGGIATGVFNLAQGLVKLGHRVCVVSLSLDKDKESNKDGVRVIRITRPRLPMLSAFGWEWRVMRVIKKLITKDGYQVIEAPAWTGQSLFYSKRFRVPLTLRLMTPYPVAVAFDNRPNKLRLIKTKWMERQALKKATLLFSLSESVTRTYKRIYKIEESKVRTVYYGLLPAQKIAVKTDPNLLLFLGRLEPRKGVDLLLQAMPEVFKKVPDVRLALVGKDQPLAEGKLFYKDWANKVISKETLKKIKFMGFVSEAVKDRYLAQCLALIAPSRFESYGLIYLEAMRCSKPVIGTPNGGAQEIIEEGINGLMADLNPRSISQAIIKIMSNKTLANKMGQEGRRIYNDKFSAQATAREAVKYYQEAINLWPER